jgi:hypothetical protein
MAKPKLALIPAAQGSKFYSVLPSSGVGDFDFTRSGSATRINSQGLIETVANGVSRLNYPLIDGVVKGCPHHILEPVRTNLIQYSEDFTSNWNLDGVTVLSNNSISPDGSLNADKITFVSGNERLYYIVSTSSAVFSVYLKGKEGEEVRIRNGSGFIKTNIRLTENWERYEVFIDEANTNIQIENINSEYVYIWGAVLESGSYSTSYIPTNGSVVTRSAETANGSGDASTFNDSEGVLMVEISAQEIANASGRRTISLSNGTNDNRVYISFDDEYNKLNIFIIVGTTQVWTSNVDISDQNSFNKITVKYKSGDSSIYVNGFLANSFNTTFSGGNFNTLKFSNRGSGEFFYGNTKQIQYFDTADIDLEQLTSWVSFQDMAEGQLYTIE